MKSISTTAILLAHRRPTAIMILAAGLALSSCSGPSNGFVLTERLAGPPPESEWNQFRIWRRVSEDPPTYLPTGYPAQAPRSETDGTWVVDKRDGKRFFVPKNGVDGFSRAVLYAEANSLTRW